MPGRSVAGWRLRNPSCYGRAAWRTPPELCWQSSASIRLWWRGWAPICSATFSCRFSPTTVAGSSGGERSFMHMIGANGRLIPEDISDDLLRATRIFHLGGCFVLPALDGEPAAGLLRRAREQGCRTSMDLAWDPSGRWMSVLEPCLPHLDFLFGNQDELGHV